MIPVESSELYQFIASFFPSGKSVQHDDAKQTFTFENTTVEKLVSRLVSGRASILPLRAGNVILWYLLGTHSHDLEQLVERATRGIVPAYALFTGGLPLRRHFDVTALPAPASPQSSTIHTCGARLFPHGYYQWTSANDNETVKRILEHLARWLHWDAEADRHPAPAAEALTYSDLYRQFQEALSVEAWAGAEQIIVQMQRLMLTPAENIVFMRLQLLAAQQRWAHIWQHLQRPQLVNNRVPRLVRAALLTGFYATHLAAYEGNGDWSAALTVFRVHSNELGTLLNHRDRLTQSAVLRVFAYQAVVEENRAEFDLLQAAANSETRAALGAIRLLLPTPSEASAPIYADSLTEQVRDALYYGQNDLALQLADSLPDPLERLAIRLRVCSDTEDRTLLQAVYAEVNALYPENEALLVSTYRVQGLLDSLKVRVGSLFLAQAESHVITTWADWFDLTLSNPADPRLLTALPALQALLADSRVDDWLRDDLVQLNARLEEIALSTDRVQTGQFRTLRVAIDGLITHFLNDDQFPRADDVLHDIYESFYTMIYSGGEHGQVNANRRLLRLAYARLGYQPAERLFHDLVEWFSRPIPANADLLLEAFDLLGDAGIHPTRFAPLYYAWLPEVVQRPSVDLIALQIWGAYFHWINPNQHLPPYFGAIEDRLSTTDNDPIAQLPEGFYIAVFSLQRSSAERALRLLQARNPKLVVQGFYETHPNEMMRQAARHADLVVLVTSCITHAITYAITPLVESNRLVYPASRGTESILRALEPACAALMESTGALQLPV